MSIEDGTFEYKLQVPFNYDSGSGPIQAAFLLFREPRGGDAVKFSPMRQQVVMAMKGAAKTAQELGGLEAAKAKAAENEETDLSKDPNALFDFLLMSGLDPEKFVQAFQILACSGKNDATCPVSINGDIKMTATLFDRMSYDDIVGAAMSYANFMQDRSENRKNSSGKGTGSRL